MDINTRKRLNITKIVESDYLWEIRMEKEEAQRIVFHN